jgi:hypothetical protein
MNKCPFCGCENSVYIEATGGEWVGLIMPRYGSVRPRVCLDCGIVYVSKDVCERIKKMEGNK